jgi:hypothetical protein
MARHRQRRNVTGIQPDAGRNQNRSRRSLRALPVQKLSGFGRLLNFNASVI